jgi:hypothetical protein
MSAIQRKPTTKKPETTETEVQEIEIPLPQPKKKGSSKQEPVQVVVDDDSTPQSVAVDELNPSKKEKGSSKQKDATPEIIDDDSIPSVIVAETKPSKKGKKSAPKSDEQVEQVEPDEVVVAETKPKPSKKGKKIAPKSDEQDEQDEQVESEGQGEVVEKEKSKKQPSKSLGELITNSFETLKSQIDKFKDFIELKEALQKHLTTLITARKKELKKLKVDDESEDQNLQFLEKQKDGLKDEITILKTSIRELASVSKVFEKATKQLESKKKKSSSDPCEPKKERAKKFVPVLTDSMMSFIQQNQSLKSNDGNLIFEQTPETNLDGRFLVETTQLMQLIHAYIRDKSLRKDKFIVLDSQLEPLFSAYLQRKEEEGIVDVKPDSASVMSVIYDHVETKVKK